MYICVRGTRTNEEEEMRGWKWVSEWVRDALSVQKPEVYQRKRIRLKGNLNKLSSLPVSTYHSTGLLGLRGWALFMLWSRKQRVDRGSKREILSALRLTVICCWLLGCELCLLPLNFLAYKVTLKLTEWTVRIVCTFSAWSLFCVETETLRVSRQSMPGKRSAQGLRAYANRNNNTFRMLLSLLRRRRWDRCGWVRIRPGPGQVEPGVEREAAQDFRHLHSSLHHLGASRVYWTLLTFLLFNLRLLLERKARCQGKVLQIASLGWYGKNIFSRNPAADVVLQTLKSKMKSWRREEK